MPNRLEYYQNARKVCDALARQPAGRTLSESTKYTFEDFNPGYESHVNEPADVRMVQRDVIDVLIDDVNDNLSPVVVNPTGSQSCGEWDLGADGFEEGLAYRTTLSMSLTDTHYPIGRDQCVYSPHVGVFRDAQYRVRPSFQVAAVSLMPPVRADFSVENDRQHLINTLVLAFNIALKHGHRSIIFNAFGCHADNNPMDIATIMGQVISRFGRAMKRITIVFDFEPNSPNLLAFRKHMKWSPGEQYITETADTPD